LRSKGRRRHRSATPTKTSVIQLCDRRTAGSYEELRRGLEGVRIVQVIHVTGPESLQEAVEVAPRVQALLLGSGKLAGPVKELGGTSRRHDWTVSRKVREAIDGPVFLAEGLKPDNAAAAMREVGPFALDVCRGARTDGRLDEAKLAQYFRNVRSAAASS
jgi:phosphoribosylanthranilate isomerase